MSATVSGVLFNSFPFVFLMLIIVSHGAYDPREKGSEAEMVPVIEETMMRKMMLNETLRRKFGSFKICALCTCGGGAKRYCLPSPCCYAINCNIPHRPFGFCSFTCNCFGCHL